MKQDEFQKRIALYQRDRLALLKKYKISEAMMLSHPTGKISILATFFIWILKKLQVKNAAIYVDISKH